MILTKYIEISYVENEVINVFIFQLSGSTSLLELNIKHASTSEPGWGREGDQNWADSGIERNANMSKRTGVWPNL